jgi:hypothetical protein
MITAVKKMPFERPCEPSVKVRKSFLGYCAVVNRRLGQNRTFNGMLREKYLDSACRPLKLIEGLFLSKSREKFSRFRQVRWSSISLRPFRREPVQGWRLS